MADVEHSLAKISMIDRVEFPSSGKETLPVSPGDEWVVYSAASSLRNPLQILRASFSDIWASRELAWILFTRDLKSQNRRSVLGYAWLLSGPIATALMWVFLRSQEVVSIKTSIPYPLFVMSGMIFWSMFRAGFDATINAYSNDILKKLSVPVEAFLLKNLVNAAFQFTMALIPLACLLLLYRFSPAATVLMLPVAVGGLVLVGAAIGCFLAPLSSLYGDVSRIANFAFTALMYCSPIVYSAPENGWLAVLMRYNPLTPIITVCRDLLFQGATPTAFPAAAWVTASGVLLLVGLIFLRVAKPHVVARQGM